MGRSQLLEDCVVGTLRSLNVVDPEVVRHVSTRTRLAESRLSPLTVDKRQGSRARPGASRERQRHSSEGTPDVADAPFVNHNPSAVGALVSW